MRVFVGRVLVSLSGSLHTRVKFSRGRRFSRSLACSFWLTIHERKERLLVVCIDSYLLNCSSEKETSLKHMEILGHDIVVW